MKAKEYTIKTFEDMLECTNEDNLDNFLLDLKGVIESYHMLRSVAELTCPDSDASKTIKTNGFVWIDDGKNEIQLEISPKN